MVYRFRPLYDCKLSCVCLVSDPRYFQTIGSANESIAVKLDELLGVNELSLLAL